MQRCSLTTTPPLILIFCSKCIASSLAAIIMHLYNTTHAMARSGGGAAAQSVGIFILNLWNKYKWMKMFFYLTVHKGRLSVNEYTERIYLYYTMLCRRRRPVNNNNNNRKRTICKCAGATQQHTVWMSHSIVDDADIGNRFF